MVRLFREWYRDWALVGDPEWTSSLLSALVGLNIVDFDPGSDTDFATSASRGKASSTSPAKKRRSRSARGKRKGARVVPIDAAPVAAAPEVGGEHDMVAMLFRTAGRGDRGGHSGSPHPASFAPAAAIEVDSIADLNAARVYGVGTPIPLNAVDNDADLVSSLDEEQGNRRRNLPLSPVPFRDASAAGPDFGDDGVDEVEDAIVIARLVAASQRSTGTASAKAARDPRDLGGRSIDRGEWQGIQSSAGRALPTVTTRVGLSDEDLEREAMKQLFVVQGGLPLAPAAVSLERARLVLAVMPSPVRPSFPDDFE